MIDNLWFNILLILISCFGFILALVDMIKYKSMSALLLTNLMIINIMIFLTKTLQIIMKYIVDIP